MKKFFSIISVAALLFAGLSFTSCESDEEKCEELLEKAVAASTAWSLDPMNNQLCLDYKNAIQDYFDGCDLIDDATKTSYEAALQLLECE